MPARDRENTDGGTLTATEQGRTGARPHTVSAPHLFVALECDYPERGVGRHSLANVDEVSVGRAAGRSSTRTVEAVTRVLTLGVADPRMSSRHARFRREGGGIQVEDLGSHNGTRLNGAKLTTPRPLSDGDIVELGHTLFRYRAGIAAPLDAPADEVVPHAEPERLVDTVDPCLERRFEDLGKVARSAAPILVLGETGTGKEVLARAIHRASGRRGEFVAINCGALTTSLLESQLFGHTCGAFSGAVSDSPGLFRAADGGTLLLDEVGELPPGAQAALLRVLQEHEVLPVGGVRPIKVNVRVVGATHRPLQELVDQGAFRKDLLARLGGLAFRLPTLRDRPEDVGLMLASYARQHRLAVTTDAGRALLQYDWPLNVRELYQVLQVSRALAGEERVELWHLPDRVVARAARRTGSTQHSENEVRSRLVEALRRHGGSVSGAARDLGKGRMQIHRWMRKFGIETKSFKG